MFEGIKGKRALITGASGEIGACIAKLFASHGAAAGIHFNSGRENAEKLLKEIVKEGGKAEIFQANLLDTGGRKNLVKEFIAKFKGIDVLINNAGAAFDYRYFSELDEKSWDDTFSLNVKSPFYLMGEAFNHMKDHGGGRIINISSANVKYGGSAKSMHYASAKAALDNLTTGFAREGAKFNILVNSIRCGVIDTKMRTKIAGYDEASFRKRIDMIPLKRPGQPIDIARMALFLASECGDFITGESFIVAGGD